MDYPRFDSEKNLIRHRQETKGWRPISALVQSDRRRQTSFHFSCFKVFDTFVFTTCSQQVKAIKQIDGTEMPFLFFRKDTRNPGVILDEAHLHQIECGQFPCRRLGLPEPINRRVQILLEFDAPDIFPSDRNLRVGIACLRSRQEMVNPFPIFLAEMVQTLCPPSCQGAFQRSASAGVPRRSRMRLANRLKR